jgi:hypothetical protein
MLFKDYKKPAGSYIIVLVNGAFTDEEFMEDAGYDNLVKNYGELKVITTVKVSDGDRSVEMVDGLQTIYVNLKEKGNE